MGRKQERKDKRAKSTGCREGGVKPSSRTARQTLRRRNSQTPIFGHAVKRVRPRNECRSRFTEGRGVGLRVGRDEVPFCSHNNQGCLGSAENRSDVEKLGPGTKRGNKDVEKLVMSPIRPRYNERCYGCEWKGYWVPNYQERNFRLLGVASHNSGRGIW